MITKEDALKVVSIVFSDYFGYEGSKSDNYIELMKELKLMKSYFTEEGAEVVTQRQPEITEIYEALGVTKDELQLYLGITNKPASTDEIPDFGGKNL